MPFKSEKQRKYLWANKPELAREWSDKYGSTIREKIRKHSGKHSGGTKKIGSITGTRG